MKIEDQVCSLEHGEELKKLGVKQESVYSYFQYDQWNIMLGETREVFAPDNKCGCNKDNLICSAFTVAELGEMLLYYAHSYYSEDSKKWFCADDNGMIISSDTEADARAEMLVYLILAGVVTAWK